MYRDVKPENFLLGRRDGRERNIIHLVDFGLAAFFRDPSSGRHLPYRDLKTMTGTARYMSVHSHLGKLQSRRDDLESIGYVLVYFARGSLPWQGLRTNNTREKYRKIRDSKMKCPARELCRGLPPQFAAYVSYVRKLVSRNFNFPFPFFSLNTEYFCLGLLRGARLRVSEGPVPQPLRGERFLLRRRLLRLERG